MTTTSTAPAPQCDHTRAAAWRRCSCTAAQPSDRDWRSLRVRVVLLLFVELWVGGASCCWMVLLVAAARRRMTTSASGRPWRHPVAPIGAGIPCRGGIDSRYSCCCCTPDPTACATRRPPWRCHGTRLATDSASPPVPGRIPPRRAGARRGGVAAAANKKKTLAGAAVAAARRWFLVCSADPPS